MEAEDLAAMAPLDAVGPGVRKKKTRPAKGQGAHRYVCVLPVCCALVALCPRWKTSDRKVYTNVGSIRRHSKSALRARYIGREMADAKASGVRGRSRLRQSGWPRCVPL